MDNDKLYFLHETECDIATCKCLKRYYRNKKIYDTNNQQRYWLYFKSNSEKSITIQNIIDILHIIKYHSIQLGFRVNIDNYNHENRFSAIRKEIMLRRDQINKIRNANISLN